MADMNNTADRALGWDDEFTNEQQEYTLLPEGDYAFEVTAMERARFEGSAKLPPCSMAKLTLKIFGGAKGDTPSLTGSTSTQRPRACWGLSLRASANASGARPSAPVGTR